MYTIKELLNYKKEVQNCKIALENGQLMDSINFVRDSEWYSDDDVQYVAMAIVDDVDNRDFLRKLVGVLYEELPVPKKK